MNLNFPFSSRQKINTPQQSRKTTSSEEDLDKTLTSPKIIKKTDKKKLRQDLHNKNQMLQKCIRYRQCKVSRKPEKLSKIGNNSNTAFEAEELAAACPLGPKENLNTSFTTETLQASTSYADEDHLDTTLTPIAISSSENELAENHEIYSDNNVVEDFETNNNIFEKTNVGKTKRQRRLSGLFPRILNTGFILGSGEEERENSRTIVKDTSIPNPLVDDDNSISTSSRELITKTKLRIRRNSVKKLTEEEIIKYYTDRDVKIKPNTLETIYEVANRRKMSVRKFKRFINFDDRMSSVKVKKRHSRIVKYDLWENVNPVNMDDFLNKIAEIEEGF